MRITYNAPITLTFSIVCMVVYAFDAFIPGLTNFLFTLSPGFEITNWHTWFTSISYVLGHDNAGHLVGNLSFILLLGPVLEERYSRKILLQLMLITTLMTAMIFYLLFQERILGASGLVFMFIILTSFVGREKNTIPLTFLLVATIFLGREIIAGFANDQVSQTAHLAGGLIGALFGLKGSR